MTALRHRRPQRALGALAAVALAATALGCGADAGEAGAGPATTAGASGSTAPAAVEGEQPTAGPTTTRRAPDGDTPVYVVVLDELPVTNLLHEGSLNATRFPNFAELAATSTWYTNWTTHSGRTIHAVPSLLSGVLPRNTLATPAEYPTNLFDHLGSAGWAVHASEHNSWLCSQARCPGARPRPHVEERGPDQVLDAFLADLGGPAWPKRTLHVVHLLYPHSPWSFLPDGTPYGRGEPQYVGRRWPTTPWLPLATGRVGHLWQTGTADLALGRLVDAIEARGEWDDALVVVTADHGQDFTPGHNSRDIVPGNHHLTAWVPTFVKWPGQRTGDVDPSPRTASELAGLVAEATGVPYADPEVGRHRRVVVTDVWPYEEGAPLHFGPVDERLRPEVTGRTVEGPGWDDLVARHRREVLPAAVDAVVGREVPAGLATVGRVQLDRLDALEGARRGGCGWDVMVSGNLAGPPDPDVPYVGLANRGEVVAVAPVEAVWAGAPALVADRPSYLHLVADPADVARWVDVTAVAVDRRGRITGRLDAEPSPHGTPLPPCG